MAFKTLAIIVCLTDFMARDCQDRGQRSDFENTLSALSSCEHGRDYREKCFGNGLSK
jgi:hypothetical protein